MASTTSAAAPREQRVAVIGCGAAGLAAAHVCTRAHTTGGAFGRISNLTLYEASTQLGGHANTVMVGDTPVDTGFLVFNENTYPNLLGLFAELNVPTEPSDMSFAVSLANRSFEWSSVSLDALVASRSHAFTPAFAAFLADMMRFNRDAPSFLSEVARDPTLGRLTMREYLDKHGYGQAIRNWYLIPQVAAVWSASTADVLTFPAQTFIQFCVNHSLVQIIDRPQWRTVSRRSREYVRRICANFDEAVTSIRLNTKVTKVVRVRDESTGATVVRVTDATGRVDEYDHVIFGAHPDQVLEMLKDATAAEEAALRGFRYNSNRAYLHTDATLMPSRRKCWSSWNYIGKGTGAVLNPDETEPCCVSYWLNRLQNLPSSLPDLFVTLNPAPHSAPSPSTILRTFDYAHPQYTQDTLAAQRALDALQGSSHAWFAGAYLGYGFHEDAITAGIRVAHRLTGYRPTWWDTPLYRTPAVLADYAASLAGRGSRSGGVPSLEEIHIMKAAGGPFWRDNLGNGGAVGRATRDAAKLLQPIRQLQATRVAGASGTVSPAELRGSTMSGDIEGFAVDAPSDLLYVYRLAHGAGLEVAQRAATPKSDVLSPAHSLGATASSRRSVKATHGTKKKGNDTDGTESSDTEVDDKRSFASDDSGQSDMTAVPTTVTPSDALRRAAFSTADLASHAAASRVEHNPLRVRQNALPPHARPVQKELERAVHCRRAYKSADVASAFAKVLQDQARGIMPAGSHAGRLPGTSIPLGDRMANGLGGYTAQDAPLHSPDAYPSVWSWLWDAAKGTALSTAAQPVFSFLRKSIQVGCVLLRLPDDTEHIFGNPAAPLQLRARIAVHSWNFFLRVAAEADLGLARAFISGEWTCDDLTALFCIFVANRDSSSLSASSLWTAWLGMTLNSISFAINLDNSLAGSRKNIHAHYDLSNDLFTSFLDPGTMMYSCGFFDTTRRFVRDVDPYCLPAATASSAAAITTTPSRLGLIGADLSSVSTIAPSHADTRVELVFHGSLEEAQVRKLDHLIARAGVQRSDRVLDLGFGWGGMSIRLAETIGCKVHGITLSREQFELASERVRARGLQHLITFEIVDYRVFAQHHAGEFDKIISVEMIEAVGHNYFPSFMKAIDALLAPNGVAVIQAITIPESRYDEYVRTTDFINTIIFPGGCLPCIAVLTDAMKKHTKLLLDSVEDFGLHYAETLRRWRANFNAALDDVVRPLGFDDEFIRTWNYYFCYCEAGFATQTLGLQVLRFTRPNNTSLITAEPAGRVAVPVGPFTNDREHPVFVTAGTAC